MSDASHCEAPAWRETQNGWTITLAEGVSANIQTTRKGFRANLMLSKHVPTIVEAQAYLMTAANALGLRIEVNDD